MESSEGPGFDRGLRALGVAHSRERVAAMQGTSRSELAAELERCARVCEGAVELYVERQGDAAGAEVVSGLLLAVAALETAAAVVEQNGGGGRRR